MTIGALTLSPSFEPEVLAYTANTTNESNKISATTDDPSAIIEIVVTNSEHTEGKEAENNEAFTWASGENIVTITVTDNIGKEDEEITVYTVTVTKA